MNNRLIRLISLPEGIPQADNFSLEEEHLGNPGNNQLLIKTLYVSVDPYLRAKMAGNHLPAFKAGDVMSSRIVAKVIDSRHTGFTKGDYVLGFLDWKEYSISDGNNLIKLDADDLPLSAYLGILGSTGLSAYFALKDIGQPKKGEILVVSGAAGAVGSIAGQIGKIMGCKVIGIVGTDEKADFILSKLGFDAAINYKTTANIANVLDNLAPQGVNVYFDNVGGHISDAVISKMDNYGRVIVCGSISNYNTVTPEMGPRLLPAVVFKKLLIQGFLITDYKDRFAEGISQLKEWLDDGKIQYAETVIQGLERLPEAFIGLFSGKNEGKMIVELV